MEKAWNTKNKPSTKSTANIILAFLASALFLLILALRFIRKSFSSSVRFLFLLILLRVLSPDGLFLLLSLNFLSPLPSFLLSAMYKSFYLKFFYFLYLESFYLKFFYFLYLESFYLESFYLEFFFHLYYLLLKTFYLAYYTILLKRIQDEFFTIHKLFSCSLSYFLLQYLRKNDLASKQCLLFASSNACIQKILCRSRKGVPWIKKELTR